MTAAVLPFRSRADSPEIQGACLRAVHHALFGRPPVADCATPVDPFGIWPWGGGQVVTDKDPA